MSLSDKTSLAIAVLKAWEPVDGYYLAFSGGKDSVVLYDLAVKADVEFDAHYCVSPIDPPPIWAFTKEYYPSVQWDFHARGFWRLVDKNGLPMRHVRWCCRYIKEAGGFGRTVLLGNRKAESRSRQKQCFVDTVRHKKKSQKDKILIRPILEFSDDDVWEYIRENNLPYCYLYDEGADRKGYGEGIFKRLGCVLCPFSRSIEREKLYFPEITKLWKRACDRIADATAERGYLTRTGKPVKYRFQSGEELYRWWVARD